MIKLFYLIIIFTVSSSINGYGQLILGSFIGGYSSDVGKHVRADAAGNIYITGTASSPDYPTSPGAYNRSMALGGDIIITKLNPAGNGLVFSTFIGAYADAPAGAVDAGGNVYIAGPSGGGFPTTAGAYDRAYNGGSGDAYVAKLDSTGGALAYSTYIGGSGIEEGECLALDSSRNVVVCGIVYSADYPTSPGAYDLTYNGGGSYLSGQGGDVFITKLNSSGGALLYSTFFGGSGRDCISSVAIDASGSAYATGRTQSTDFPMSSNAIQPTKSAGYDCYVAKFSAGGDSLRFSTYLGGNADDYSQSICIDNLGNSYITGFTNSTDFPVSAGIYQSTNRGFTNAFVSKLGPTGAALLFSTYLGGTSSDDGQCIAIDNNYNVYVAGRSSSNTFPVTSDAYDGTYSVGNGFLSKLNASAATLLYSTFFDANIKDMALDRYKIIYLTGSATAILPTTTAAFDNSYNGGPTDAFVSKIGICNGTVAIQATGSIAFQPASCSTSILDTFYVRSAGTCLLTLTGTSITGTNSLEFSRIEPAAFPANVAAGDSIRIILQFSPNPTPGVKTAVINIGSNAPAGPISISLTGTNSAPTVQSTGSLAFGPLKCASWSLDTFYVRNPSPCVAVLNGSSLTGANSTEFSVDVPATYPVNIMPADSVRIVVRFSPSIAPGARSATLNLANNTLATPLMINLSGNRAGASIQSIDMINFSSIMCQANISDTFYIKNAGETTLSITNSTITGINSTEFSRIAPSMPQNVLPCDSARFIIKFSPSLTPGNKSATLSISNNSAAYPYQIALAGRKDSIYTTINSSASDTIDIDLGVICTGTTKDTTIMIINTSTIGTMFTIDELLAPFMIENLGKVMKKEEEAGQISK